MSSISVDMSYLFCEIDCRKDMWQNHFANTVYGISLTEHKMTNFSVLAIKNSFIGNTTMSPQCHPLSYTLTCCLRNYDYIKCSSIY